MKVNVLAVVFALLVSSIIALPYSIQRRDLSAVEDDPIESDPMDQIAEESELHETVIPVRPPRGSIKYSVSSDYKSDDHVRTRKVIAPPANDNEDITREQNEKKRSLMVVLPYNTRNLSESKIQELYTKRPVTWIINTTTTTPAPATQTESTDTTAVVTPTSSVVWRPATRGPTTQAPPVIRDDVRELLASIGLFAPEPSISTMHYEQTTSNPQEFLKDAADSMTPEMKKLLGSLGLLNSEAGNEIPRPIVETKSPVLSPVFQHSTPRYTADIDPSSYTLFKPIPNNKPNEEISGEMKDFLASFGLVDTNNAAKKNTKPRSKQLHEKIDIDIATPAPNNIPTLHPDSMSHEMKEVMHALGFAPNINPYIFKEKSNEPRIFVNDEKITNFNINIPEAQARSINSASIFSPTASVQNGLNNTEDFETLKTLVTTYKLLSKNASTPEELEEQLQTATQYLSKHNLAHLAKEKRPQSDTLDKLLDSPDPLSHEELLIALNEAKNDVYKRQENNKTDEFTPSSTSEVSKISNSESSDDSVTKSTGVSSVESTSTESVSSTSTTERTEDTDASESDTTSNNSASIADLESSFGGSTGDSDAVDENLPPPRPNGFYFLLDLNTFLNVGEDDKGVNIKFAPRAGSSRNFLPITVP